MPATQRCWPFRLLIGLLTLCLSAHDVLAQDGARIEGAFGLSFDRSLAAGELGASLDGSPIPLTLLPELARALPRNGLSLPPDLSFGWHHFQPASLPSALHDHPLRFFALQVADAQIAVIAALMPENCGELAAFFTDTINRKYQVVAETVPLDAEGLNVFDDIQRWSSRGRVILLACGSPSYLLYADPSQLERWRTEMAARKSDAEVRQRMRLLAAASHLLPGSGKEVTGAFGFLFSRPVPDAAELPKEKMVPIPGPTLPPPWNHAVYEALLAPTDHPIRLAAEFSGVPFDAVKTILESRLGKPMKTSSRQVLYRVNGNLVSLRSTNGRVRLAVVDGEADRAMRARTEARAHAAWEADVEAL
ncbi:MAG: hypothetical protein R3E84_14805 [Pseudomonadales bacterium]